MAKYIEYVSRRDDMSERDKLTIMRDNSADILVSIWKQGEGTHTVEFCINGQRSPNTFKALLALAEAMELDNQQNPINEVNND
jgi:hypothetical protein